MIRYVLMIGLAALLGSCSKNDPEISLVVGGGHLYEIFNSAGEDLLDPATQGYLSRPVVYVTRDEEESPYFESHLQNRYGYYIYSEADAQAHGCYAIAFTASNREEDTHTVIVEWKPGYIDTIREKVEFVTDYFYHPVQTWLNGELIYDRELEIQPYPGLKPRSVRLIRDFQ